MGSSSGNHFLNAMNPQKHIFLLRFLIDQHNQLKNRKLLSTLQNIGNMHANFDSFGRVYIGSRQDKVLTQDRVLENASASSDVSDSSDEDSMLSYSSPSIPSPNKRKSPPSDSAQDSTKTKRCKISNGNRGKQPGKDLNVPWLPNLGLLERDRQSISSGQIPECLYEIFLSKLMMLYFGLMRAT